MATVLFSLFFLSALVVMTAGIGVNYGLLGDNLPPPSAVIRLYQKNGIDKLRLFGPNPDVLDALRNSGISVSLGVANEDISKLAGSVDAAGTWVYWNVMKYSPAVTFSYITVGNEVVPGSPSASIAAAMKNIQVILDKENLGGIKVTTVVHSAILANTYPPSNTVFTNEAREIMRGILSFLSSKGNPLLVNVYPYFPYASGDSHLDYATFTATGPVVWDSNGLSYTNMFDAMVDGYYYAMEKIGFSGVSVVVSETGWPSAGNGDKTTPQIASTYNNNFISHLKAGRGTPKRPGSRIEGYIFAMFNENQKTGAATEKYFGLFQPDMTPAYKMTF